MTIRDLLSRLAKSEAFRWVAVVPGAVLCAVAALFPLHWLVLLAGKLGTSTDDSGSGTPFSLWYWLAKIDPEALEYAGAAFLTPFIVLNTAARIAPRFKFATAVALAVAFGVGYVYIYMQVYEEIQAGIYDTERYVKLAVNAVLQIVGVSSGLIVVHRKIYRSSSHDLE